MCVVRVGDKNKSQVPVYLKLGNPPERSYASRRVSILLSYEEGFWITVSSKYL